MLRDGISVLPTGRNIHALDPYRMPSAAAWARGQRVAQETIRQHLEANGGLYPETVAVTLWGLDTIKTRGESIAIVLALVGAKPITEGTGRVVRFDLVPLKELGMDIVLYCNCTIYLQYYLLILFLMLQILLYND